jgi:hypothetical protein
VYEDALEKGEYVIVSYSKNNDADVDINYKITRLVLMPILWLISIIFIIIILLCIVRIFLLEKKKRELAIQPQYYQDYAQPSRDYGSDQRPYDDYYDGAEAAHYGRSDQPSEADYGYARRGDARPRPPGSHPETAADSPPSMRRDRAYYDSSPPPQGPGPRPPARRNVGDQYEYADQGQQEYSGVRGNPPDRSTRPASTTQTPVTVPCKCGEFIEVYDSTRPIRIQCKRCGRRGTLEAKKSSEDDKIFY